MRVLVTGASGFVGRTLVPMLQERGCIVTQLGRQDAVAAASAVVDVVVAAKPDVVVHLATNFSASHEPDDIPALIRSNVEFGTVVAEAALRSEARFVNVGSAWQHYQGHDYDPVSLYAATKQALASILTYYANVRGLDAREVTLFDTYGPGDVRPKLIPTLLGAARTGAVVQMSDGSQLIDLTYVEDVGRGICTVALDADVPAATVLRSWTPVTINELVSVVEEATGRVVNVARGTRPSRPREMTEDWRFGVSPQGWTASVSLLEGLRRTWES